MAEQLAAGGYYPSVTAADAALSQGRQVYRDGNGQVRVRGYSCAIQPSIAAASQIAALRSTADGELFSPAVWSTSNKAGGTFLVKGVDAASSTLWVADGNAGVFRQSPDFGVTYSASKGLPANVDWSTATQIVKFGSNVYLLGMDSGTSRSCVWQSPTAAGDNAFSWTKVLTMSALATAYPTNLAVDASFLYAAEYGDVVGGPSLWRSSDGAAWTQILGPLAGIRHIHAVACDPYNAGHVWLALGDGVAGPIRYSTDSAATWTNVPSIGGSVPQVVELSFSPGFVWGAGDGTGSQTVYVIDRASKTWRRAASNRHDDFVVPGTGEAFDASALWGVVDPVNEVYWCSTPTSGPYPVGGLWVLPAVGDRLRLVTWGETGGRMFVFNSQVWFGAWHRPVAGCDWFRWSNGGV